MIALLLLAGVFFGFAVLCLFSKLRIFDAGRSLDRFLSGTRTSGRGE